MGHEIPSMKARGQSPLSVIHINGTYIVAVYQGSISQFDLLLKYRQKENGRWSRIRTPKHIHWAVDVLIKMYSNEDLTKRFIDFLIKEWENTSSIYTEEEREKILNAQSLLNAVNNECQNYATLSSIGEYNIKFLILIAKLLMCQEKTNRNDAYMFKKLLDELKEGKDIFKIVAVATFRKYKS